MISEDLLWCKLVIDQRLGSPENTKLELVKAYKQSTMPRSEEVRWNGLREETTQVKRQNDINGRIR